MSRIIRTGDGAKIVVGGIQGPQGINGPALITAATATSGLTGYLKAAGNLVTAVATIPAADLDSHVVLDNRGETINTANQTFNIISGNGGVALSASGDASIQLVSGGEVQMSSYLTLNGQGGGAWYVNDAGGTPTVYATGYNGAITAASFYTENGYGFADNADAYFYSIIGEDLGDGSYVYPSSGRLVTGSWSSVGLNAFTNDAGFITSIAGQDYNLLSNLPTIPTLTSQLTNDSGFITSLSGYATESWVTGNFLPLGSLSGYATESYVTSQGYITSIAGGDYNSLANLPTIPTDTAQLTNGAGFITAVNSGTSTDMTGVVYGNGSSLTSDQYSTYPNPGDLRIGGGVDGQFQIRLADTNPAVVLSSSLLGGTLSIYKPSSSVFLTADADSSALTVLGSVNVGGSGADGLLALYGSGSDLHFSVGTAGEITSNQITADTVDTGSTPATLRVRDTSGNYWYLQGWSAINP